MNNINLEIFKEFVKLTESEKKEVIDLIKAMAAMTKKQSAVFHGLMNKTVKAKPETELNTADAAFMRNAAEAVLKGVPPEVILKDWTAGKGATA